MAAEMKVRIEMGRRRLTMDEIAAMDVGCVIELDASPTDDVAVQLNGAPLALGEPVVVEGELGVRIRELAPGAAMLKTG